MTYVLHSSNFPPAIVSPAMDILEGVLMVRHSIRAFRMMWRIVLPVVQDDVAVL